jgi:hypothetical protein
MTDTQTGVRAFPRTNAKHWVGVTAADIPQGWMDDMVRRLFDVLNRSMIRLETAAVPAVDETADDAKKRKAALDDAAKKVRLVNQMQTALERLSEMENKRVRTRNATMARSYDDARKELKRRLDQILGQEEDGPDQPRSSL